VDTYLASKKNNETTKDTKDHEGRPGPKSFLTFVSFVVSFGFPIDYRKRIPASLRESPPPLLSVLNCFFIIAYCLRSWFTCWTLVPDPRAIRLRRLPLIAS